jgi:hypothetical protein
MLVTRGTIPQAVAWLHPSQTSAAFVLRDNDENLNSLRDRTTIGG